MTEPTTERDAMLRQLADTVAALEDVPSDDFTTRVELRDRLTSLRAALADATEGRTRPSLEQELDRLEQRLASLHGSRPNVAAMSGAGEGDDGIAEAQQLAERFDDGQGRADIEERIRRIRLALRAIDERDAADRPDPGDGPSAA